MALEIMIRAKVAMRGRGLNGILFIPEEIGRINVPQGPSLLSRLSKKFKLILEALFNRYFPLLRV